MFKDYDKYLSTSLKVYLFVLIIIFILKLVGLDYFGLQIDHPLIIKINDFCKTFKLDIIISYLNCFINFYIVISIMCNENNKKIKLYTLLWLPIIILFQYLKVIINNPLMHIFSDYILTIMICYFRTKKLQIKKFTILTLFIVFCQFISMIIRSQSLNSNTYNFSISLLMNLDFLIMIILLYKLYFMRGGKICYQVEEVFSYLPKKMNLKNLQKKLQKNYSNFKKLNKQEKATIIIYSILSLFWNVFTLIIVLFIAKLNDTFIECIFILTSFWLSKKVFGKPFHLKSMTQCFIVSNMTYYVLNRITTPTGISILIPIMLGVGLSYITSKLVKKTYKPLYKGMPKEEFENTILKVVDKDSNKYNICYDFFINKQNAIYLSHKYNYSEAGIRKITSRVNDDIKALNK